MFMSYSHIMDIITKSIDAALVNSITWKAKHHTMLSTENLQVFIFPQLIQYGIIIYLNNIVESEKW